MHYLILLNKYFIRTLCFCLFFSYSLVAQSPNSVLFELNQYEFEAGSSAHVDLNLTMKNSSANVLEIRNPFENAAMVVESIKKTNGNNSTELWLTKDSVLFAKNIPQTAWIINQSRSTVIRTATALQSGDQIFIRLLIAVPPYAHSTAEDNAKVNSSSVNENYLFVAVSLSTTPSNVSTYKSSKPIRIKHQGSVK